MKERWLQIAAVTQNFMLLVATEAPSCLTAWPFLFCSAFSALHAHCLKSAEATASFQGGDSTADDLQLAVRNPAWAQQASSALAAITRERVELQRAVVEAEDSIVRSFLPNALACTSTRDV